MSESTAYVGQRLSLKKQTCTVRYIGSVADKQGSWLGVEWDDSSRGKHDGTHDGVSYFKCRSKSPTAASFLRATQPWDEPRTFLQALREKYISPQDANNAEIVYISGKHAEEVGLEKLAKRQALLQGIHTLVLDRMCIRYRESESGGQDEKVISGLCKYVTSLDVGGNLFESWEEVLGFCRLFPRLRSLTLDGNRIDGIGNVEQGTRFSNIRYLGLTDTLLRPGEIVKATKSFPFLGTLILATNELEGWDTDNNSDALPTTVHSIDLSGNQIATLDSLTSLLILPHLHTLLLKANKIGSQPQPAQTQPPPLSTTLQTLDLRSNSILDWSLPSSLTTTFPSLSNLLIASNPLYASLKSADDKPLTPSDGYTLTLARLPQLQTLNYSTITDKERLNAETYYLGQIARELAKAPTQQHAEVLSRHPRWKALCEEYGEPVVPSARAEGEADPASLAARLVSVTFHLAASSSTSQTLLLEKQWTQDIPRSASVYALLGRVGKKLGVMPLRVTLVWETGERDPVRRGGDGSEAPECWDSSEEEDDSGEGEWTAREVELVPGTRMVGSYFEGMKARVRVEIR